jgi:4-hydroxy-tetrahydrodipicolinate synthase
MTERWQGTFTALVTPFDANGSVDEAALARLVDRQIEGGVEGIVPCGTTGESATLSPEEQLRVIDLVRDRVSGRVKVVAGVGGNNTANIVARARDVASRGVDAILSVVPYYNKPTPEGLFRHFSEIADAADIPVLLYNVPGRTSANLDCATLMRLAEHENIQGVKEASGNLVQVMEILSRRPGSFAVLSGEDNLTLAIVALGGDGVISVVSNEVPGMMSDMVREALSGRLREAREMHYRLLGLMNGNFFETNPIPVKAALAMMGLIEERYRLPLVPMSPENRARLQEVLTQLELM